MKNKKIIRLFTAALAVALCATAFAVPAFAGGGEGEPYYTETAGTEADPAEDAEAPEVTITDEEDPAGDDSADNNTEADGDTLDQITELLGGLGTVTVTEDGILFTPDTEKWETQQTGTVTTTGLTGADLAVANPDYAFFKTELKADGNTLTGTLSRDVTKSFASYADTANGRSIAGALEGAASGPLFDSLIGASKTDVQNTYRSLGDDFFLNTRNAGIINGMTLSRAVKDQAAGIGEGRKAEMAHGTPLGDRNREHDEPRLRAFRHG